MSWDLAIWRGCAVDSARIWKKVVTGQDISNLSLIPWDQVRAAVVEAFGEEVRVTGDDIQGRGWELLRSDSRVHQVRCAWGFASNLEFLRSMLRAVRRLGGTLFDPQLDACWPDAELADSADPWSSIVFDRDDGGSGAVPTRLRPDWVDVGDGAVVHAVSFDGPSADPVLGVQLLVSRLARFHAFGFRQRVQLDPTNLAPELFQQIVAGANDVFETAVIPSEGQVSTGVHLGFLGHFELDELALASQGLHRIEVHPPVFNSAEKAHLAAIFGDMALFVWIRRHDLEVALDEVTRELTTLWTALEAVDRASEYASTETPARIVNVRTGKVLSVTEVRAGAF